MSYLFSVPPQYQALVEAGKLIRRGALLINSDGGGIVAPSKRRAVSPRVGSNC